VPHLKLFPRFAKNIKSITVGLEYKEEDDERKEHFIIQIQKDFFRSKD